MGMFESYFNYKKETHMNRYIQSQAENTMPEEQQLILNMHKKKKSLKLKKEVLLK